MKSVILLTIIAALLYVAVPVLAVEEDAVAAIYAYGRTGTRFTMGFAVADGSFVLTTVDSAREVIAGKSSQVPYAVIVSRWTGDAYVARVVAYDEKNKLALFKLPEPAFPAVAIADDKALSRVKKRSLGDVLSGDDAGEKFSSEIVALTSSGKARKLGINTWHSSAACTAEVTDDTWLFLSQVTPLEKVPDAAAVIKPGIGAIGLFYRRIVVTGGAKPVTYYKSVPATTLRAFLTKSGVESNSPSGPKIQASDGDASFRAMCAAISASLSPTNSSDAAALTATKYRPKSALAQMLYGTASTQKGNYDQALKSIDAALLLDPAVPDGDLNRGVALAAAGKADEAEKAFRKAATLDSTDPRPRVALTDLLLDSGTRVEDAMTTAKDAVSASPDNLPAKVALARAKKHSKDYEGAIIDLEAVIKTAPSWTAAHVALAATYRAGGKKDLAEAEYRKVITLQPSSAGARFALIDFLLMSGKNDAAVKEIESARKLSLQAADSEALKKLEAQAHPEKK